MSVSARGRRLPASRLVQSLAISLAVTIFGLFAMTAVADAAIGVSAFSLTPSTATKGENPDLAISATRSGSSGDVLKQAALKLPAGLGYSVAATTKCSNSNFDLDRCPASSVVGTTTGTGTLKLVGNKLVAGEASGTVYAISNTQIGMIYHPSGIPRIAVKATISGTTAAGITITAGNFPRTALLFGRQVDLTISGLTFSLYGKSGATKTGPVVVTNPAACGPATSTLTLTAYNGSNGSLSSSFDVTGCGAPIDNVPPSVTITAPTAGQVIFGIGSTTARWVITDTAQAGATPSGVNDAATTCSLAGPTPVAMSPCPGGAKSFTGLPQGSFVLTVRAVDNAGNTSTATRSFSVVNEGPEPPVVTIAPPTINGNSATATWTISQNTGSGTPSGINDALTRCSLAGPTPTAQANCPGGTKTFTGLANGSYVLSVNATDNAGNVGPTATRAFVIAVGDIIPPTVTITAPASNQTIPGTTANATWTISDTSQAGVTPSGVNDAATTCSLSGPTPSITTACPGGAKTFTGLAPGSYTLTVNAADNAGTNATATRTFTIVPNEVEGPFIQITAPAAGATIGPNSAAAAWTITGTFAPVVDSATRCSLAGPTPYADAFCPGGGKTFNGLANGNYTLTVTATDSAGNTSMATRSFFIAIIDDAVGPTVTITSPTAGQGGLPNTFTATWSIVDTASNGAFPAGVNDAATTCSLAGPTPVASTLCPGRAKTFTGLATGAYTLTVTAVDNAGNASLPTTRSFNVGQDDNIGPTVNITAPSNGQAFVSNSVTAAWTIADTAQVGVVPSGVNHTATTCSLSGPTPFATAQCPGGVKTFSALANGTYILTITAWDNFGNSSVATRTFAISIQ